MNREDRRKPIFRDDNDPTAARDTLNEALQLWRGPALLEFLDHDWARPLAIRLARLSGAHQRLPEWLMRVAVQRGANHYDRQFDPYRLLT